MDKDNLISEELLNEVYGGLTVGLESDYETAEDVVFLFEVGQFVRIAAKMMRGKVMAREARLDDATGKYGACYLLKANSGVEEWYMERGLTAGTI